MNVTPIFGSFISGLLGFAMFIVSLFLILLILVQRGRGGGLTGALGGPGGQSAFGTKAGDLFTRITSFVALGWITLCAFTMWQLGPDTAANAVPPGPAVSPSAAERSSATSDLIDLRGDTKPADTKPTDTKPADAATTPAATTETGAVEATEPAAESQPAATTEPAAAGTPATPEAGATVEPPATAEPATATEPTTTTTAEPAATTEPAAAGEAPPTPEN